MMNKIAQFLNSEIAKMSSMEIGKVLNHPDGRLVKICDGCFLDPHNGRVSNFWYWNEVLKDGSLGKKECGYGW